MSSRGFRGDTLASTFTLVSVDPDFVYCSVSDLLRFPVTLIALLRDMYLILSLIPRRPPLFLLQYLLHCRLDFRDIELGDQVFDPVGSSVQSLLFVIFLRVVDLVLLPLGLLCPLLHFQYLFEHPLLCQALFLLSLIMLARL